MPELHALIEDLVAANHILYHQKIVDGYGHVSFRSPVNAERFYMAAAIAPGRVGEGDIVELDLDGEQVAKPARHSYSERFIHAEIYRVRSDVNAIAHSHSPAVIPFGVTDVPLRPIVHNAPFLQPGVPVFDTRHIPEAKSPLVDSAVIGAALASLLADHAVILMRGHGNTVVGPDLRETVSRAIYTEVNARLLLQTLSLGRPVNYLDANEAHEMIARMNVGPGHGVDRVWQMWADEVREQRRFNSTSL